MTIDINKKYKTKNGHEVRIYATDGAEPHSVHGAYFKDGNWFANTWRANGKIYDIAEQLDFNLIEVKPRIKRTVWLNVYPNDDVLAYPQKALADNSFKDGRIVCVKVEIDCEEGEGL
jgi:hypothetical protein